MYMNQFQACLLARFEPTWKTQTDSVNTKASSFRHCSTALLVCRDLKLIYIRVREKMWNIACTLGNLLLNFTGQEQLCRPTNPLLANIFFALAKIACTSNFAIAIKLIDPLAPGYWTVVLSLPVHVTVTCSYNHINTFIIQSKYFSISDWLKSHI